MADDSDETSIDASGFNINPSSQNSKKEGDGKGKTNKAPSLATLLF